MHSIIIEDDKIVYVTLTGRIRKETDYALLKLSNVSSRDVVFDFKIAESIDAFFIELLITLYLKGLQIKLLNVNKSCNDRLTMSCIDTLPSKQISIICKL